MRSYLWPFSIVLLLVFATASFAGDLVGMPTGNQVAKGKFEYNYIFLDLDTPPGAPDFLQIHEFFFGATDRLEVDVDVFHLEMNSAKAEVNPYLTIFKETDDQPSFIVGVYNLFREDMPAGNKISPFFVSAYNVRTPTGTPKLSDPLIRGHFGWGTGQHDSDFFGGVQFLVHPKIGAATCTYTGCMGYLACYSPRPWLQFRGGILDGDEFGALGIYATW
jgi:hypothetical protein